MIFWWVEGRLHMFEFTYSPFEIEKRKRKNLIGATRWEENSIYNNWDWTMTGHRAKLWRGEKVHAQH